MNKSQWDFLQVLASAMLGRCPLLSPNNGNGLLEFQGMES